MRNFFLTFKRIVWLYVCILLFFTFKLILDSIPDSVYVNRGEVFEYNLQLPVCFFEKDDATETLANISDLTYRNLKEKNNAIIEEDCTLTCLLFGFIPIKEVQVQVVEKERIYASGRIVGIYGETNGVFVIGTSPIQSINGTNYEPAENLIHPGDYILAVNQEVVDSKESLIYKINHSGGEKIDFTINRNGEIIDVAVKPVPVNMGKYMVGIWVKDDIAGIGTMTYYKTNQEFAALGHGIGDAEVGTLMEFTEGDVFQMQLTGVKKGEKGTPGELQGAIFYEENHLVGELNDNMTTGIFGTLMDDVYAAYVMDDNLYEIGYKQEIEIGEAEILSDISGTLESYRIKINKVDYKSSDLNKGIKIEITDKDLLKLTGGIVQGMSGSPIIQDGKIIGAVTHVLVNDPTRGYGIFIENMLEH